VLRAKAAVGQRAPQQRGLLKDIAQPLLQRLQ
jgi:hypothetical protein